MDTISIKLCPVNNFQDFYGRGYVHETEVIKLRWLFYCRPVVSGKVLEWYCKMFYQFFAIFSHGPCLVISIFGVLNASASAFCHCV